VPPLYKYLMIQIPPNIRVSSGEAEHAAADYLQELVDFHASRGWEFYRMETIGIEEAHGCGCLGSILGMRSRFQDTYVAVFRRLQSPTA
jgi:hypothetical protein